MHACRWGLAGMALLGVLMAAPAGGAPLPEAQRKQDPRLEQRVTLAAPRVFVGDLLERLSARTGISLWAGERDGAADPQVSVFLHDAPLGDAMDALWSLMSYQEAAWQWERDGEPGHYTYHLTRPLAARQLGARLRQQLQEEFEGEAVAVRDAQKLPVEEQKRLARRDPRVATMLSSPRAQAGQRTFFETLPSETQARVLRAQETVRVPLGQLSEQGRAFVDMVWSEIKPFRVHRDGSTSPARYPTFITFYARVLPGTSAPSLFISIEGAGGYAYLGARPLDLRYQRKVEELWTLPGDGSQGPRADKPIPAPPSPSVPDAPDGVRALELRLRQMALAAPLSVMARVPDTTRMGGWDPGVPYGQTVEAYLRQLESGAFNVQHKWRSGILLLTYPSWFHAETTDVPWALVKRLRRDQQRAHGLLPVDDLIRVAAELTSEQAAALAEGFPGIGPVTSQLGGLLALMGRTPGLAARLLSPQGVPAAEVEPALGSAAPPRRSNSLPDGTASVRLEVKEVAEGRLLRLRALASDGRELSAIEVTQPARRSPEANEE